MKYYGTEKVVMLGDRVVYRHFFFGQSMGSVSYLPDQCVSTEQKTRYDTDDWVVDLDNGKSVFMLFYPGMEFAHRRIRLVERGQAGKAE